MVYTIRENAINLEELHQNLVQEFKGTYKITKRKNYGIVLAKTKIIGVTVILKKNKLHVSGNFTKSWMVALYTFSLIYLAFIPLVLYYIFLDEKMKTEEAKVVAFINKTYT